ncbi:GDYXXLXY domain-containing protein [Bacillus sp. NEB1478]|uniref:GDYXXLXY domain-containing protein n=1 Tax=Bacillus sp. NEB1478 TaxID=3073816 RepID=UPI002872DF48|nr:GDYXXLXY domain-containing protein [Bacillus sp. NEB1478]WNB91479.1 GDYXXLXY domain-containing protein [Bacillus sp. NEB1478]
MSKKRGWMIAAALQVLFLLFIAGSYYSIDYIGKEIKIKTEPIDPTDILYGDYVTLNFDISTVPISEWHGKEDLSNRGQSHVYVLLEKNKDGYYGVSGVYPNKPEASGNQVILNARADRVWIGNGSADQLQLTYGFERYYVQENTGKNLEEKASDMDVTIGVAPWGASKILSLTP